MHNILIVDDEPLNIKLINVFLEEQPYKLFAATDSNTAWELLKGSNKFSLILLDRMLPEIDGITLAKQIHAIPELRNIPIIMQSAAGEKSQIAESTAANIAFYLIKPYDAEDLIEIVASTLAALDKR